MVGCNVVTIEKSTNSRSFIINETNYIIKLIPYDNGNELASLTQIIQSSEEKLVLDYNNRGKGQGFAYPRSMQPIDSIIVLFDDKIKTVHYTFNVSGINPKAIKFGSPRNIYTEDNFVRKITAEDKYNISNEYRYTFVDQDYEDAKK